MTIREINDAWHQQRKEFDKLEIFQAKNIGEQETKLNGMKKALTGMLKLLEETPTDIFIEVTQ